jgi:transcription-repair coupling factor (superfamily II helicase)
MTTLTLKLEINEQLAEAYKKASPEQKNQIKKIFNALLQKAFLRDKARVDMYAILQELHNEAEINGLSDEILEELLTDYD